MPVQGQLQALAALIGCGAALGVGYDLYNTVLQERRAWRWLTPFADLAFWTAGLLIVFRVLLSTVDGEMRLSFLAVIGLGFGLYRIWGHRAVVRSTERVTAVITYCVRLMHRLMIVLVWRPVILMCRLAFNGLEGILRVLAIFENMMLWPLGPLAAWWRRRRAEGEGVAEASRRGRWNARFLWTAGVDRLKRLGRRR